MRSLAAPLTEVPARKKERRSIDKALTLAVQQISGTRDQVAAKARELVALIAQLDAQDPACGQYARRQLASKLATQCDAQVARLPAFAFPLAEVAAQVAVRVRGFEAALCGVLLEKCALLGPLPAIGAQGGGCAAADGAGEPRGAQAAGAPGAPPDAEARANGLPPAAAPAASAASAPSGMADFAASLGVRAVPPEASEPEDDRVARVGAFARFLAAIAASDAARNAPAPAPGAPPGAPPGTLPGTPPGAPPGAPAGAPSSAPPPPPLLLGLPCAWLFLARLLNQWAERPKASSTRCTAAVLEAFLDAGGHALFATYGNQFLKLLRAVETGPLPRLLEASHADPNLRAGCARIQLYLEEKKYQHEPEGRSLPKTDASSYDRA